MSQPPLMPPGMPIGYATPAQLDPTGRRAWLNVAGVLLIVAGALAGCMSLITIFTVVAMASGTIQVPGNQTPASSIAMALPIYIGATAALITLGIGSIRGRRWVRPIVVTLGILAVLCGLAATVGMAASMSMLSQPGFLPATGPSGTPMTPPPMMPVVIIAALSSLFFTVFLPGLAVWLYTSEPTRVYLDQRDPRRIWTDACPLPVFFGAGTLVLFGAQIALAGLNGVALLFGVVLQGIAAFGALAVQGLLMCVAGVLFYRLKLAGWTMALVLFVLMFASWIVSAASGRMADVLDAASPGLTTTQRTIVTHSALMSVPLQIGMSVIGLLAAIGYLVWVKRFFAPKPAVTQP
ncbi:MAG: hypothetical protein QM770_19415 [Tepidisphaeraceae bacterium]